MFGFSSFTPFLIFFALTETFASEIYTNVWAVKMSGGQPEVEKLALKYDLSYDKHVSTALLYAFRLTSETEVSFSEVFLECFLKALTCNWPLTSQVIDTVCLD